MIDASPAVTLPVGQTHRRDDAIKTAADFMRLTRGYWLGWTAAGAWTLTAGILLLVILGILMQVGINRWYAMFFNAVEQRSWGDLVAALPLILRPHARHGRFRRSLCAGQDAPAGAVAAMGGSRLDRALAFGAPVLPAQHRQRQRHIQS